MRMNKLVGVGLLVVVLATLSVVAGFGVASPSDSVDVNVDFAIPSYIAIYAPDTQVTLGTITGPGTYEATNTLYVVSTTGWSVNHSFVWTTYPNEGGAVFAPEGPGGDLFSVSGDGDGVWGWDSFTVTYELELGSDTHTEGGNKMQYFPAGDYMVTVTHTATTSE